MVEDTSAVQGRVLLEEPRIEIEGDELVVPGWRFALAEIESARVERVATAATGPILMVAIGIICLLSMGGDGGTTRGLIGAGMLVGAGVWWTQKKPFFKVALRVGGSEATAFESEDEETASKVRATIEGAIAH